MSVETLADTISNIKKDGDMSNSKLNKPSSEITQQQIIVSKINIEERTETWEETELGNAWTVGSPTNAIVGTWTGTQGGGQLVVGASNLGTATIIRAINPNNIFIEEFDNDDFIDTSNSTGTRSDGSYLLNGGGEVAQWKLNGDSTDSVNSFNGTDTDISYVTGKLGNAADFNGTSSVITMPNSEDIITDDTSYSISLWFNTDDNTQGHIFITQDVPFIGVAERLRLFLSSGNLKLAQNADASGDVVQAVSNSVWYHVVITYDGTNYKVYVNNSLQLTTAGSATSMGDDPILLGNYGGSWYNGKIDEVRIFNKPVSSDTVSTLYNSGDGTEDLTGRYQSKLIAKNNETYTTASLSIITDDDTSNAIIQISGDGGSTYETVTHRTEHTFSTSDTNGIKFKINANGTDLTITQIKVKYST